MWRESRCKPNVENPNDPHGGSIGLLQINRGWVRWLRELHVIDHSSDLYKPHHNLAAGRAIYEYACSRHGQCWIAWGILNA
jgi:soluble lytic murein transglycosylase-like protein